MRATARARELLPQPRPPAEPMSGPKRERDPICDVCGHCHVQGVKCTICGHVGKYIGAARARAQSHPHATPICTRTRTHLCSMLSGACAAQCPVVRTGPTEDRSLPCRRGRCTTRTRALTRALTRARARARTRARARARTRTRCTTRTGRRRPSKGSPSPSSNGCAAAHALPMAVPARAGLRVRPGRQHPPSTEPCP